MKVLKQKLNSPASPNATSVLNRLSSEDLITGVRALAAQERALTARLLEYLEEIEARKLHLVKYSSMHEFVIQELGFCSTSAHLRVSAMRLNREIPEVKTAVEEGRLQLSNVCTAVSFFNHEKKTKGEGYSTEEKRELLKSIENKSTQECKQALAKLSPDFIPKEKTKPLSQKETQIQFVADRELMADLDKIRALWSHIDPKMTYLELFKKMSETVLGKIDPMRKITQTAKKKAEKRVDQWVEAIREQNREGTVEGAVEGTEEQRAATPQNFVSLTSKDEVIYSVLPEEFVQPIPVSAESNVSIGHPDEPRPLHSRYSISGAQAPVQRFSGANAHRSLRKRPHIPQAVRSEIWTRDQGKCSHTDLASGRRCNSVFQLEIDHIRPYALGGLSDTHNLRLLCRAHNQYYAFQVFGEEKMERYVRR